MKNKKYNEKEQKIYLQGYNTGKRKSLEYNMLLLKGQINAIEEIVTPFCIRCKKERVSSYYKNAKVCDSCKSKLAIKANKKGQENFKLNKKEVLK